MFLYRFISVDKALFGVLVEDVHAGSFDSHLDMIAGAGGGAVRYAGGKVDVDEVGDGKVSLDITQFTDVDDDINVTFGGGDAADINVGDADHAGDVDVVTEGAILVNEAVKPSSIMWFIAFTGEKSAKNSPPIIIPMNSEL